MATRWATQVVEREMAVLSPVIEEYPENDGPSLDPPLLEQGKARSLRRMAAALVRFFLGVGTPGLLLPLGPGTRSSRALSFQEKAWLKAYWKSGTFI